ncbi:YihY/virulence factor BrkB family protein [Ramlibacter rhizophilus]|nr:YihY/virulence factor BrkB family protein [Ramlibacter rhizophilus]
MTTRQFLRELYQEISRDNISNGAAVLGFYLTLAVFPAAILTMALIPYLPIPRVDDAIMDLLRQALPQQAAEMFTGVVEDVTQDRSGGLLSFGILGTIWATSTGMYAVMQQLNASYKVPEGRPFVKARLVAIGLSILFVVLVLLAFSMIVLGGVVQDWIGNRFGFSQALLTFFVVLRWVIIVLALFGAFVITYYYAPNTEQRLRYVLPGSVIGALVLIVASGGFAFYVQNFGNYNAVYGSIGAVIALMLWLYIAGLTILLGSEVNALLEHHSSKGKSKGERAPGVKADEQPS